MIVHADAPEVILVRGQLSCGYMRVMTGCGSSVIHRPTTGDEVLVGLLPDLGILEVADGF